MPDVKKILAVDDDGISLKTIEKLLTSFGYDVVTATGGPEALGKLSEDIQMVLLDVVMPDMDGLETARQIRKHPEFGDIPIIMVTGLTRKEDRLAALQAGANDFVSKPLDRVELEIRVASHLKLKEAQDKRRESDARYRMLVEKSPVGILCCSRSGEISEINPAAASLFEIPLDEQNGPHNVFENPELSRTGVSDLVRDCLESGEMIVKEAAVSKHGDKHARLYVVPVHEKGGGISGFQIVAEDISDQKRAEELTRRRTRLRALAEMAMGSVKHFSESLKEIEEQVNTGLATVQTTGDSDITPSLNKIRTSLHRASQTLRLLEKFARGYAKRDTPAESAFNFSDAVREALESTKPTWKDEPSRNAVKIDLQCDLVEECFVEGERADVVEVVANLIRNAAEAMPHGGKLRIVTHRDADQVVLDVQDEGTGMTEAQVKRLGSPFLTSKESHVGLGLAVSLGIIRRHRGSFSITSKQGRGTTISVKFLLTVRRREEGGEYTLEIPLSNPKILFVDPDDGIKTKFSGEAQAQGPIYFVRSAVEAVQMVHEKNIDAIVCSEAIPATRVADLSKAVIAFCAGKGTVRPPFIVLVPDAEFEQSGNSLSDVCADKILRKSVELPDLMQIILQEVRSAVSGPRMAGSLGHVDILDVVQMMLLSGQQLVLEVISPEGNRGLLYISNGQICHARRGALDGEEAAYWALGLRSGFFAAVAWSEPERTSVNKPGETVLMEAARRRDEDGPRAGVDPDSSF